MHLTVTEVRYMTDLKQSSPVGYLQLEHGNHLSYINCSFARYFVYLYSSSSEWHKSR